MTVEPPPATAAAAAAAAPVREMPLTLGDSTVTVAARAVEGPPAAPPSYAPAVVAFPKPPPFDPRVATRRCRLKADACRWAIERRRALSDGVENDEISRRDQELFDRAEPLQPCYLWMMHTRAFTLPVDGAMEDIAGSFDALAAAIELLLLIEAGEDASEPPTDAYVDALGLLAEAQSAVRVGCMSVDRSLEDRDQKDVFHWLRDLASSRGVFVERHMRLDDPAEPSRWLRLAERIGEMRAAVQRRQSARDQRRSLLNKARYHAKRIAAAGETRDAREDDWAKVAAAVGSLVADGVPPSDREVRDILLPLVDDVPEMELGSGMTAVLDQIDRYRDQLDREPADATARAPSATLTRARDLLRGRRAVLIGGYPRELHRLKIEQAFELAELRWVAVLHHQSLEGEVLSLVKRPEFTVFVTMTRFRSHLFGPQLREWCKQHQKVYLELPAGYGIEQIAHQVLAQASGLLGPAAAAHDHG